MAVQELLRFQLDDGSFQLDACFEPMDDAQFDTRTTASSMTPRETAEHLCDCYEAFLAHVEGRTHEWGNFSISDKSKSNLLATLRQTRDRAVAAALAKEDAAQSAHMYVIAHDYYHVGQLCLVHMATNPEWDPYSIYRT